MLGCTIVTTSQLPSARALAQSLAGHDPEGSLAVLVLDADRWEHSEPFELVTADQLRLDTFHEWAALCPTANGLASMVRPWLLRELVQRGSGHVAWIDPEIWLLDRVIELADMAERHGAVLLPRFDHREGHGRSGTYDSGMFVLGEGTSTEGLLTQWCDHTLRAAHEGRFENRRNLRFLDSASNFYENAAIFGNSAIAAYWNLDLAGQTNADRLAVGNRPVRAINFRGFDPTRAHWLSDDSTAVRVTDSVQLAELCREYAGTLVACGASRVGGEYRFSRMANGSQWTDELRRQYAMYLRSPNGDHSLPNVFTPDGTDTFLGWMRASNPRNGSIALGPALLSVHERRDDLQAEFPDPRGRDADRFVQWAQTFGIEEEPLLTMLARPQGPQSSVSKAKLHTSGVNVCGYLRDANGLGQAARLYVQALRAAGVPVSEYAIDLPLPELEHVGAFGAHPVRKTIANPDLYFDREHEINLICVNAPELARFKQIGHRFPDAKYRIGVWAWEAEGVPREWRQASAYVDEIWVYSSYVAQVLGPALDVPVICMSLPIVTPERDGESPGIELPDGFKFLFCFDHFSTIERKNPLGLIEAFKRAFRPGEGPSLTVKSINADYWPDQDEQIRFAALDRPDIFVVDEFLSPGQMGALLEECDCFVSLHRSEGFGLLLAEAMALGRPTIATGYSGNTDFMTSSNSYLTRYSLSRPSGGGAIYPTDSVWAEPDLDHAASLMREVFEDPAASAGRGARAQADVGERFSLERAGALTHDRIAMLSERIATPDARSTQSLVRSLARQIASHAASQIRERLHSRQSLATATTSVIRPDLPDRPDGQPAISVLVATIHPWPEAHTAVEPLHEQIRALGGELILLDGHGEGLPEDFATRFPGTTWLRRPGAKVCDLHAQGVTIARGEVVAITEDHCIPAADWCERILAAHRDNPSAKAVGGAIENGSPYSLVDWANYLFIFGPFAPPLGPNGSSRVVPPANISYKRQALPDDEPPPGWLEFELNPSLLGEGAIAMDERVRVSHVQSKSLPDACRSHFRNGRSTTGLVMNGVPWRSRLRLAGRSLRRPQIIFNEAMRGTCGKGGLHRRAVLTAPIIALLAISHGLGEAIGMLAGPGPAPQEIE